MTQPSLGPAWLLVALSVLADVLGIFSFVGLDANRTVQIAAMVVLGLLGVTAALTQLIGALKLSLSVRGAYYRPEALRGKVFTSLVALIIAVALVAGAAVLAFEHHEKKTPADSAKAAAQRMSPRSMFAAERTTP